MRLRRIKLQWKKELSRSNLLETSSILETEERRPKQVAHFVLLEGDCQTKTSFGFIASPPLPIWENTKNKLAKMTTTKYFNKINKLAYNNLCSKKAPPTQLGTLLGLGLRLCLNSKRPQKESVDKTMKRMKIDVRIKCLFTGKETKTTHTQNTLYQIRLESTKR